MLTSRSRWRGAPADLLAAPGGRLGPRAWLPGWQRAACPVVTRPGRSWRRGPSTGAGRGGQDGIKPDERHRCYASVAKEPNLAGPSGRSVRIVTPVLVVRVSASRIAAATGSRGNSCLPGARVTREI